jgi:hypothetical protein
MSRSGETREELLALTKDRGYEVSAPQLARWHRAGLLPGPKQRSLGKGRGTQTVYPPGTEQQLLRLCQIHFDGEEKRLLYVGWRLWWEGYDTSTKPVRAFLSRVARGLDEEIGSLVDPATGRLSETRWEELMKAGREARLGKPLGRVRRRLGRERMPTFISIIIEVVAGVYDAYQVGAVEGTAENDSDARILEAAIGFGRGQATPRSDPKKPPGVGLEATLKEGSRLFREHSLSEVLTVATDEELSASRDQVRLMILSARLIGSLAEQVSMPEAEEVREADRQVQEMGPSDQALMVLCWTMWRLWGPSGARTMLDSHHDELKQAVGQLHRLGWDAADAMD